VGSFLAAVALTLRARPSLRELYQAVVDLRGAFIPPALWTHDPDLPA
jgi:hypothetical protein